VHGAVQRVAAESPLLMSAANGRRGQAGTRASVLAVRRATAAPASSGRDRRAEAALPCGRSTAATASALASSSSRALAAPSSTAMRASAQMQTPSSAARLRLSAIHCRTDVVVSSLPGQGRGDDHVIQNERERAIHLGASRLCLWALSPLSYVAAPPAHPDELRARIGRCRMAHFAAGRIGTEVVKAASR
jgi:hypothetical protein